MAKPPAPNIRHGQRFDRSLLLVRWLAEELGGRYSELLVRVKDAPDAGSPGTLPQLAAVLFRNGLRVAPAALAQAERHFMGDWAGIASARESATGERFALTHLTAHLTARAGKQRSQTGLGRAQALAFVEPKSLRHQWPAEKFRLLEDAVPKWRFSVPICGYVLNANTEAELRKIQPGFSWGNAPSVLLEQDAGGDYVETLLGRVLALLPGQT